MTKDDENLIAAHFCAACGWSASNHIGPDRICPYQRKPKDGSARPAFQQKEPIT